jgi:surface polysaccharide O-acyltransferase-like enzyme
MPSEAQKKIYLDYLRSAATLAVVVIHATSGWYGRIGELDQASWWTANLLNAASRFAVPLFVMISGALLLGKPMRAIEFYRRRAVRLLPPIFVWSVVYLLFRIFWQNMDRESLTRFITVGFWSEGYTYVHLWYLTMFACLMLFAPFINQFVIGEKPSAADLLLFSAAAGLFFLLNSVADAAREISSIYMYWHLLVPWYIAYFIIGYFIDRHGARANVQAGLLIVAILLLVAAGAMANFLVIQQYSLVKDYFVLNDKGLPVFCFAILVFLLGRKSLFFAKESKIVASIAENSFGIYLIHPLLLDSLSRCVGRYSLSGDLFIPVLVIVTFVLSWGLIAVLRKNAWLRKTC